MGVTISVADVLDQVAFRLHIPTFSAGEFVTQDEAIALVKASARRLSGLMSRLYGDGFWASEVTLSTQADIDILSLPSDFASLRSVHWINDTRSFELQRADVQEYDPQSRSWTTGCLPKYRLEGTGVLVFTPVPSAVYSVRVAYQNAGIEIEDINSDFQGMPGWDEWLVCDVCQRIREREQKPADEFIRDRLELEEQLKDQASQRDRFATVQARDSMGVLDRDRNWRRYRRNWWY